MKTTAIIFYLDDTATRDQQGRTPEVGPYHIRLATEQLPNGSQVIATVDSEGCKQFNPDHVLTDDHVRAAQNWLRTSEGEDLLKVLHDELEMYSCATDAPLAALDARLLRLVSKIKIGHLQDVQRTHSEIYHDTIVGRLAHVQEERLRLLASLPQWATLWVLRVEDSKASQKEAHEVLGVSL